MLKGVRTTKTRLAVLACLVLGLVMLPVRLGSAEAIAAGSIIEVSEACAQSGYGCARGDLSPACPDDDLGDGWYCNFGCD